MTGFVWDVWSSRYLLDLQGQRATGFKAGDMSSELEVQTRACPQMDGMSGKPRKSSGTVYKSVSREGALTERPPGWATLERCHHLCQPVSPEKQNQWAIHISL